MNMMVRLQDDIVDLINREIARAYTRHPRRHIGLVDSYNPNDHTIKAKFLTDLDNDGQPKISGWIPVGTQGASENGVSFVVGPNVGDQVVIDYAEGDAEAGHVSHFLHNTVDVPPNVASGAAVLQHNKTGNHFTINTDGSMMMLHKASGNYSKVDASGNVVTHIASTAQQHYLGGDPALGGTFLPVMLSDGTPSPYAKGRKS
jgi:uncharacterized protein involved in type VI secretion and phage assembly